MGNHRLVSVNLNKSYGESSSNSGVSYGLGSGRGRGRSPGRVGGGIGVGVGGGDVSGPISRSGQKKLCVPPPLNLPSLRKQHLTSGGGCSVSVSVASVPVSGGLSLSSWSKPSVEKEKEKEVDGAGVSGVPPGSGVAQANMLRGEDFPTLKATVNVNASVQKEKHKDLKQEVSVIRDDALAGSGSGNGSGLTSVSRSNIIQPPLQLSDQNAVCGDATRTCNSSMRDHQDGGDYFPDPLPLVRLNPRSDWADDERDTSHGMKEIVGGRDHSYSTTHAYWDMDFDWPRPTTNNFRSHKLGQSCSIHTHDQRNVGLTATRDFSSGRRDLGHVRIGSHLGNRNITLEDSTNTGAERGRYSSDSNRHKVESVPNYVGLRPSFSSGSKGFAGNNKHSFSRVEKLSILEDWDSTGFDGQDSFSSGIVGALMKKNSNRLQDFHDPVRESFEAELERVQKIQEQERQRIIEEQEKVMEVARREQEERLRISREQEERQRKLEEEAREASWRAEQEKIETLRRAEEQRLAREEEKRRVLMEEERRKQAAKQKLLELEEQIARRQTEAVKTDNGTAIHGDMFGGVKDKTLSKADDFSNWEDGEKMVERITNTASSDSSSLPVDLESRPVREGSISFVGRGKPFTWRRDIVENGNSSSFFTSDHGNSHQSLRQDASSSGRAFPRKDSYAGAGYMPTRDYYHGGIAESHMDDLPHAPGQRWKIPGDGDPYCRNMELEADFHENVAARFDVGWGQGQGRGNSFAEQFYQNSELDELYTYGRSRYPARQPRVLPPPSLSSVHRSSFNNEREHSDSAAYEDGSVQLSQTLQSEHSALKYQNAHEEKSEASVAREQGATNGEQELNRSTTPGCDSQCSLSVSSPPTSTHLSHDNLDDSRDCMPLSGTVEPQDISHSESKVLLNTEAGNDEDDDEEWAVENNEELQEQEEYDEDVRYQEEDEAHEVDEDNPELGQEFQDNMVLGFDQGVEVGVLNDEYEPPSANIDGSLYMAPQAAVGILKEEFEDNSRYEQVPQVADALQHVSTDSLSVTVQSTSQSFSQEVTASGPGTPVKLQFRLFSGLPLIPSPVPSIQIGSIQMPLQLHPQIGPSLTHMHAPQPPLFQFGQLGYPSPISPGIFPSMPFIQPNVPSSQTNASNAAVEVRPECGHHVENVGGPHHVVINRKSLFNRAPESRRQGGPSSSHSASSTRDSTAPSSQGQLPRSRQRRFAYTARNFGAKVSSHANDRSYADANGFQRRPRRVTQIYEFRVRQGNVSQQSSSLVSPFDTGSNAKSYSDGNGAGKHPESGSKKEISSKPKRGLDYEVSSSDQFGPKKTGSGIGEDKPSEGSLKRNISSEDVDAPLQSGIVHVFDQPGIEAPSDDDDFIEVRSKRQMLNDRRELREREIKAKSSIMRKSHRKSRPTQSGVSDQNVSKTSMSSSGLAAKGVHTGGMTNRDSISNEMPVFNNVISQTLAASSTHPLCADSQADAKHQTIKLPQTSSCPTGRQTESDRISNAHSKVVHGVHSSAGSCDNSHINQPVMSLTQTQFDEAMKPVQFDKQMVSVGDRASSASESGSPSSSVLASDSRFALASSPISSLLAGEKIQFGAITSPTILTPSTHVSLGSKPPVSTLLNVNISQSTPASGNDSALLFEKERHSDEPCPLEDCEAEAEAAASVVAVASIGNVEAVGNGVGGSSASISNPRGSGDAELNGMTAGLSCEQESVSQPKAEVGLSVTLPTDLSIETPPVSLWPPFPSPHSSSGPMLSPLSSGQAYHFPFYDMNSMMGGPVFAFGTHEESAGAHSQPQKTIVPNSPPIGTWQHCHTCVDSFYRPSAGFTTPFISPPGSIQGVQGPPHMVVYNHFAPVGQFGQVGLSYMGAAYIPSRKQPDWKHSTTPSDLGSGGNREVNNLNVVSVQCNSSNMPTQVPHLAPGSPLLSTPSPLSMFDVSSSQNSTDPSSHPHWSQVQASPVSMIPHSMPMQQQDESSGPSQSNHFVNHRPLTVNGLTKAPSSSSLSHPFLPSTNTAVLQFPDELRLGEAPAPSRRHKPSGVNMTQPRNTFMGTVPSEGSGTKNSNPRAGVLGSHNHKAQMSAQQKNSSGQSQYKNYQRGSTQRSGSGTEWSSRKMGFHGRSHSFGGERGLPLSKVKQIYVAKQSTTRSSDAA